VAFSPNAHHVATAGWGGEIEFWHLKPRDLQREARTRLLTR
jgi:hypothetical protein